ncbi:hypothetical protein E2562_024608 [Oryza meyeriana var. granulata]|uniref:Uncharacterized protein n=1 Tax=Oryza meyeriana var. granulata TaxID=110450 RepID=A0A6G1DMR4_9ORYZ|nr:hypothetical protein E2562_024608 [Oryza meyeriana var. granulata]
MQRPYGDEMPGPCAATTTHQHQAPASPPPFTHNHELYARTTRLRLSDRASRSSTPCEDALLSLSPAVVFVQAES